MGIKDLRKSSSILRRKSHLIGQLQWKILFDRQAMLSREMVTCASCSLDRSIYHANLWSIQIFCKCRSCWKSLSADSSTYATFCMICVPLWMADDVGVVMYKKGVWGKVFTRIEFLSAIILGIIWSFVSFTTVFQYIVIIIKALVTQSNLLIILLIIVFPSGWRLLYLFS